VVDGGTNPSQGAGFTAVTFRRVSCGFSGNILCQIQTSSNAYFISLLFAHHNVQLASYITVQETGKSALNVTRQSYSFFEWNPTNAVFPIKVTVLSIYGDTVTFNLLSLDLGTALDTGGQFPDPPAGLDNAQPGCSSCSPPIINNGQTLLFLDSQLPQQKGPWIPLTQSAWSLYSSAFSATTNPQPLVGTKTGVVTLAQYGEIHFGSNVRTPSPQVTSVTLLIRIKTGSATLSIWSGSGAHSNLVPDVNASWQRYTWPIAGNPDVGATFNDLQIQTNTAGTFYVDDFRFVLAPSPETCTSWYYPQSATGPVGPPSSSTTSDGFQLKIGFQFLVLICFCILL